MDSITVIQNHKFILFVPDHYNPLGMARSLGEQGISPTCIVISKNSPLLGNCKYVKDIFLTESYEKAYQLLLEKFGTEKNKPFVIASNDEAIEVLDAHYDDLKDSFYIFNAGEKGRLHWLMNKDNIVSLAKEVGFSIPKSEVVNHGELPTTLKYPIITKTIMSIMGGWKDDVFICGNERELKEAYTKIKTPKLILQEFIKKKTECCFEGFACNHGGDVYIPFVIKYLRFSKKSYGHYMTVEPLKDEVLRSKLYELIRRTKFEGIFDIEFLQGEDNELYFLEVNFRSTTWSYTLTSGGVNAPVLWAEGMLRGSIDKDAIHPQETMFTAMNEPSDFKENVIARKVGIFRWLKEFKKCQCTYYWNKNDRKPFFHYLIKR